MQPAICAGIDYAVPFAEALPLIRQAGFEVISLGARADYSAYATPEGRDMIRRLTHDLGLSLDSVHAPFPEGDELCSIDEGERLESLRQCEVAIEAAHDLEAGIVVVHLNTGAKDSLPEGTEDQARRSMEALGATALARAVRIAVENSWGQAYGTVLDCVMTEFSGEPFGLCYDSGHENVNQSGFRDLETYGHRLLTLHLHDNQGEDTHALPYEGSIDWSRLMGLLRGFDYQGPLQLEVCTARSAFQDPALFLAEAWKRSVRLLELAGGPA